MSSRFFLFFLLLLSGYPLFAQIGPVDQRWGQVEKMTGDQRLDKIVAAGAWGSILARKDDRSLTLEHYDASQTLRDIHQVGIPRGEDYQDIISLRNRFFLLTTRTDQRTRATTLVRYELNRLTFSPYDDGQVLALLPAATPRSRKRLYDLIYAPDSSRLLLYYQTPRGQADVERFSLRVLQPDLSLVWQREVALNYADALFHIQEYQVDPAGRVYMLGRLYQDRPRPTRNDAPNYRYLLLSVDDAEAAIQEYEIGLGDNYISELTFRINRFGNLVFAGLYSEHNDVQVRGACYFRIDPIVQEAYDQHLLPFELSLISDGYRESERNFGEKGVPELFHYRMRELVQRSDGGAVLVAEQYFVETKERMGHLPGVSTPEREFHYNDILVVNIQPGGVIEWAVRIPKRQATVDDGGFYSGFGMATVQDGLYFVYNDNARNFGPTADVDRIRSFSPNRSVLVVAQLTRDGQLTTRPLFENKEKSVILRPKLSQQTGPAELLLYGEEERKYRLVRVVF